MAKSAFDGFQVRTTDDLIRSTSLNNVHTSLQLIACILSRQAKNDPLPDDEEWLADAGMVVLSSFVRDMKRIADALEKIAARPSDLSPARQAFAAKLYQVFQQR